MPPISDLLVRVCARTRFASHFFQDGVQLLMMGTADALPEAPVQKTVFMEDMSEDQLASALELPPGLKNLGNTCYMNACIQCLRTVPELKSALKKYKGGLSMANPAQNVSTAMKDLFTTMENTSGAVPPIIFVQVSHILFRRTAVIGSSMISLHLRFHYLSLRFFTKPSLGLVRRTTREFSCNKMPTNVGRN